MKYETVSSYLTTLKELVATCKFGQLCDEMIRDQLKENTHTHRIKETSHGARHTGPRTDGNYGDTNTKCSH